MDQLSLKERLLNSLHSLVVLVVGVVAGVAIIRLSNEPENVLTAAVAIVFGYGIGTLADDLLSGVRSWHAARRQPESEAAK